jgi:multiphosphoryl transfer protein
MTLVLAAPLAGWATRLEEVPDPAFAQGLVGDGVAIDPTSSELCAPCDGVVSVHRARHACTVHADAGAEILLHVGIDTVELAGEGFQVLVANGQRVRTGDPVLRFDVDLLARRAKSLHTPVVLVGGDGFAVMERVLDRTVAVGDFLLSLGDPRAGARQVPRAVPAASSSTAERRVRLGMAHGLHARTAAVFSRRARQHPGEVTVACRRRSANGKSVAALMALDARLGDELTITASGAHAVTTVSELAQLVAAGLGDPIAPDALSTRSTMHALRDHAATAPEPALFAAGQEVVLRGSPAAAGLAIGRALRIADAVRAPDVARDGAGAAVELAKLAGALADVRSDLEHTIAVAGARGDTAAADILRTHLDLVDDPELGRAAEREITAGRSAAWAWRSALGELATVLRGLGNPILAERTGDVVDLERRTLARLAGTAGGRIPAELPDGAMLFADELLPSELAALPQGRIAALCTARGGTTSHAAILAAGLGVPAVVAIGDAAARVPDGAPVIVDGDRGQVRVFPAAATREEFERAIAGRAARRRAELDRAHEPALTLDGASIEVLANLGSVGDAAIAMAAGAEGCGLLRTEFAFTGRADRHGPPSEDEQAARYQQIADALHGRPLVIRTLDAGGDKPLAFAPQAREDNPALGVRGVRLALRHPELLRTQLRAILRVTPAGACRIMVPMIASLAELRAVRAILDDERRALAVAAPVALGAMIEVPAAALLADALAREADFFSIGTNDLAQYALAMDRGNPDVSSGLDALHPGVLRLIASTVAGARAHDRAVSVCGGAAAEPLAVPILLGLGIRTLSVAPAAVPQVKAVVRTLSLSDCDGVARRALALDGSDAVRALVASTWPGLIVFSPWAPLAPMTLESIGVQRWQP